MDLAALIASFATSTGSYTVTRRTKGGFVRGRAQSTTDTTLTITASVQPASGRDLLRLPEGRRMTETRVLFTTTLLLAGDSTREADLVTINGESWETQTCEQWIQAGAQGTGYRCIVQAPA